MNDRRKDNLLIVHWHDTGAGSEPVGTRTATA
jgi:hypothetical protein